MRAQHATAETDRNSILIGERIRIKLTVSHPSPSFTPRFILPDSIFHFLILEVSETDSVKSKNGFVWTKSITLTGFDSGRWFIPSFKILLQNGIQALPLYSDSLEVNVEFAPMNGNNQMRDIKPIMEEEAPKRSYLPVLLGVVLLLTGGYIIYQYYKKRKLGSVQAEKNKISAFEEAMGSLHSLSGSLQNDPVNVRHFYKSLSEICIRYLSRNIGEELFNNTTGDLLLVVKQQQAGDNLITSLAEVLRCADAVKFAKYLPLPDTLEEHKQQMKQAIISMENYLFHTKIMAS